MNSDFKPKIVIVGHGRHGKDTVAEILAMFYGMSFMSSSMFCADHVIYPALKDKYNYTSVDQCFEDRCNHRAEWFDLIQQYCADDPSRLGREIFEESDIYCGLRNKREFAFMKNAGIFDLAIWVDRSDHLPPEDKDSNSIEPWMADFIIDNNGSRDDLTIAVKQLFDRIMDNGDEPPLELKGDGDIIQLDFGDN